jgi:lipopolysaccharide transport system permease protein
MKVLSPKPDSMRCYLRSIKAFRQLIITIGIRDLKNKYAQSFLGIGWAILQPVIGLAILSFVFGYLLKIQSGGFPYPIFAFTGMLAWYTFMTIMGSSGYSLIENKEMIKKIFFPKIILPFSKVISNCVEFGIWIVLLLGLMLFYGIVPSWRLCFFPLFFIFDIIIALSVGLWLSALTFRNKDLSFFIPYIATFGIFITPVFYPNSLIPVQFNFIKYCNPLAGIVEGFRWSFLGTGELSWKYCVGYSLVIVLFLTAFFYFRKIEGKLSDVV